MLWKEVMSATPHNKLFNKNSKQKFTYTTYNTFIIKINNVSASLFCFKK